MKFRHILILHKPAFLTFQSFVLIFDTVNSSLKKKKNLVNDSSYAQL